MILQQQPMVFPGSGSQAFFFATSFKIAFILLVNTQREKRFQSSTIGGKERIPRYSSGDFTQQSKGMSEKTRNTTKFPFASPTKSDLCLTGLNHGSFLNSFSFCSKHYFQQSLRFPTLLSFNAPRYSNVWLSPVGEATSLAKIGWMVTLPFPHTCWMEQIWDFGAKAAICGNNGDRVVKYCATQFNANVLW